MKETEKKKKEEDGGKKEKKRRQHDKATRESFWCQLPQD